MTVETKRTHSRRVLLGAAAGTAAATALGALARPLPAAAGVDGAGDEVHGIAFGSGNGVRGDSVSGTGVYGMATSTSGRTYGVYGRADSSAGTAVFGYAGATSGTTYGTLGYSNSPYGKGATGWSGKGGTGLLGYANSGSGSLPRALPSTGVYGVARGVRGRGGQFSGHAAQVRLIPSAAATHPPTGLAGDLFMDRGHRLWVCKGGSHWKQIA